MGASAEVRSGRVGKSKLATRNSKLESDIYIYTDSNIDEFRISSFEFRRSRAARTMHVDARDGEYGLSRHGSSSEDLYVRMHRNSKLETRNSNLETDIYIYRYIC